MNTKNPAIKVSRLSKRFDSTQALTNVSFEISPGTVAALIGPNGAGKTTLIKCLVGLHSPSKGKLSLNSFDIQNQPLEAKKTFGYVPDMPTGFDYLSGQEFLNLTASLKKVTAEDAKKQTSAAIELFNLGPHLSQRLDSYSRGSRQKLTFISALLGAPKILIVDEPIVGLDPDSIENFGSSLKDFAANGGTVLFSTHILEFAKRFANQAIFLDQGKLKLNKPITNKTSLTKDYQKCTS